MARTPHAASRTRIASGLGPTREAGDDARVVARARRRGRGSRRRRRGRRAAGPRWRRPAAAASSGAPNSAATSRAMPTCDSASGRFGVTLTSSTSSSRPTWRASSAPAGASGDRIKIPSPASLMPSSTSLQSMPGDDHAADLLAFQLAAARQRRARRRPRDLAAGRRDVARAADDLLLGCRRPRRRAPATACPRPGAGACRAPRRRRRRHVAAAALDRLDLEPDQRQLLARRCRRSRPA